LAKRKRTLNCAPCRDCRPRNLLATKSVFAFSRNPINVDFAGELIGEFSMFPNWILLIYLGGRGVAVFTARCCGKKNFMRHRYCQVYVTISDASTPLSRRCPRGEKRGIE
jgi:hypothetical protein